MRGLGERSTGTADSREEWDERTIADPLARLLRHCGFGKLATIMQFGAGRLLRCVYNPPKGEEEAMKQ